MAIEPRGTGDKVFPDIVTVAYPGNYPVAIAQVESRETVTREQATQVYVGLWAKHGVRTRRPASEPTGDDTVAPTAAPTDTGTTNAD